jgi:NAD(P)-dependent dehydrogenase (short-subunit alcohol dehydrogenase family)
MICLSTLHGKNLIAIMSTNRAITLIAAASASFLSMVYGMIAFLPMYSPSTYLITAQNSSSTSLSDPREQNVWNSTLPDQVFPGLHSNWDEPPDCGETSYNGTGVLVGRRALITGGDSGMGRALAIAFAREGADVVINYLPEEQPDADEVVSAINSTTDSRIYTVPGDLRNEAFCDELVAEAVDLLGGLDILINNAGFGEIAPNITSRSRETFRQTIETNIYAPFYLTQAAVPHMPPGSSIVFTSSLIYTTPPYTLADYASSKAYLYTFASALAAGLMAEAGIKVNAVRPAVFLSNFLTSQGQTTEQVRENAAVLPLGRIQQPIDLVPQYLALIQDDGSFATAAMD